MINVLQLKQILSETSVALIVFICQACIVWYIMHQQSLTANKSFVKKDQNCRHKQTPKIIYK